MDQKRYIQRYAYIKNNHISLNNEVIYKQESGDFGNFMKSTYKALDIKYPKFFKMDNLSKLSFLAAEVIFNASKSKTEEDSNIAIVFSNRASSLDTDRKHQKSIEDSNNYYPSPAVFVYTLPNICIGEISIRHTLYSENSFFIFDHFNAEHLLTYSNSLLDTNKAKKVLCGWVDFDNEDYEALLYLVGDEGSIEHNTEEIVRLYKKL